MEQTEKRKEVELIKMNILDDGRQLSVRFPKHVVEALEINPEKDVFIFQFDKENLELIGSLEDKELWEKEYGKRAK